MCLLIIHANIKPFELLVQKSLSYSGWGISTCQFCVCVQISLGRRTKDNHVDVDLSLEGPAWKISRRQGIIKLR